MANEPDASDDDPEVIRAQMQETRTALTEKLEALEHQVVDTVQATTSTVAETVQQVKAAVEDTVGTVKDTVQSAVGGVKESVQGAVSSVAGVFDVRRHVRRLPLRLGHRQRRSTPRDADNSLDALGGAQAR